MEENNIIIEPNVKSEKLGFFKKFWYSITNFDKYMEMALQGPYKAFIYTIQITFLMCIFLGLAMGIHYISLEGIPQDLTNVNILSFLTSKEMSIIYIYAITLFFQYFVIILTYIVLLAIIGYITARIIGIKMRYQAVYSIASYAITLSTILYTSYLIVNIFTIFKMKYIAVRIYCNSLCLYSYSYIYIKI